MPADEGLVVRRAIRNDIAGAARCRDGGHPRAADLDTAGEQPGGDDQFFETAHPGHTRLLQGGVDNRFVTGERSGMGEGRLLPGRGAAGLESDDRLAGEKGLVGKV